MTGKINGQCKRQITDTVRGKLLSWETEKKMQRVQSLYWSKTRVWMRHGKMNFHFITAFRNLWDTPSPSPKKWWDNWEQLGTGPSHHDLCGRATLHNLPFLKGSEWKHDDIFLFLFDSLCSFNYFWSFEDLQPSPSMLRQARQCKIKVLRKSSI